MAAESKIVISNVDPAFDGEYEYDFDRSLSAREWRWVKQISGGEIRPASLTDADVMDPDFVIAMAVIALHRQGKIKAEQALQTAEKISDAPLDEAHILMVLPDAEVDEIPPASTTKPTESSPSGLVESETSNRQRSDSDGSSSRNGSEGLDASLARTGLTKLATSSASAQTTSTT